MKLDLTGRTALITGASAGIGAGIARAFAEAGARVVVVARSVGPLQQLAESIGPAALAIPGDVTESGTADRVVREAADHTGKIDVLVNNAAFNVGLGPLFAVTPDDAERMYRMNVLAPQQWAKAVWDAGMGDSGGVILNISSVAGQRGGALTGTYAITKAALDRLTTQLAWELAPQVRVVGISPGVIETELSGNLATRLADAGQAAPLGRAGTIDDVATLALFLATDAAAWITGTTVLADGGELAVPLGVGMPSRIPKRPGPPSLDLQSTCPIEERE